MQRNAMQRRIVGFHQDNHGHWVAELECGHDQHVRHRPPWINRPWVVSAEGRRRHLGHRLVCKKCDYDTSAAHVQSNPFR